MVRLAWRERTLRAPPRAGRCAPASKGGEAPRGEHSMSGAQSADGRTALPAATIGRGDTVRVALASLVSAITGYAILALAARLLVPIATNTIFVTFWSTLFACFGVLS